MRSVGALIRCRQGLLNQMPHRWQRAVHHDECACQQQLCQTQELGCELPAHCSGGVSSRRSGHGLRRLEPNGSHEVVCSTNIRCEGPSHSRLRQVRAGFELQGQQCTLPCAHPHVPRCGTVRCEEHAEEANGDLEAEQLLRLSSVTKCRSRIMGLCFGGAATGPPCETCRRSCWREQRCMVSLLLLCGLCSPSTICPASLMVCYRTCGPR